MKVAIIESPRLYDEDEALLMGASIEADYVVFYGEIFRTPHALSINLIRTWQEILSMLAERATVIVFYDPCLFAPNERLCRGSSEIARIEAGQVIFQGRALLPGLHDFDTGTRNEVPYRKHYRIELQNDDFGALPEIAGRIDYLELRMRDCTPIAAEVVRARYGRLDKIVTEEVPVERQTWKLSGLRAENVFCYRRLEIDFENMPPIFYLTGPNGSGKSSVIAILEAALSQNVRADMLRKGERRGSIEVALSENAISYTIDGTRVESTGSRNLEMVFCKGDTAHVIDAAATNRILAEFCDFTVQKQSMVRDGVSRRISKCSAGQKFLIELATKLTIADTANVIIIDECVDRLDGALLERFLANINKFAEKVLIIGHRPELRGLPGAVVEWSRGASTLFIGRATIWAL